ncbi:hypothetical protein B0H10DRAFT_1955174 [Mycena sp. CBHHK59/15]|nr:hypothetical protein B0H10DRAFT_1955174 [Mycena sp. CBHHK59/15]
MAFVAWMIPSPDTPLDDDKFIWHDFPELGVETWVYKKYAPPNDPEFPPQILPLSDIQCQVARGKIGDVIGGRRAAFPFLEAPAGATGVVVMPLYCYAHPHAVGLRGERTQYAARRASGAPRSGPSGERSGGTCRQAKRGGSGGTLFPPANNAVKLVLNVFEGLSCFGPRANFDYFKATGLVVELYHRLSSRPENTDSLAEKDAKAKLIANEMFQYLSCTGLIKTGMTQRDQFEETMGRDPIAVWTALDRDNCELPRFALTILQVVVNQAGCERAFSDVKNTESPRCSRLGLEKFEKMTKQIGTMSLPTTMGH